MLVNTRRVRIEWGDCDPCGIIFYPRYLDIFDASTSALIERALGMLKRDYLKAYGFAGHPLVRTHCRFLVPTRFGDDVVVATAVTEFRRSSFDVLHRLTKDETLAVEATETRVWVQGRPVTGAMEAVPVPQDVIERLSRGES
jgi:4-hydroxybenzoyl-CoA thioesterase